MVTKVLVDANVIYSLTLRNWLCLLKLETEANVFTIHFTEDVMAEAIYHLRRDHPTWDGALITDIRSKIETTMDSRVDEYPNDGSFPGIDEHDQHVHAAAVHAQMDIILTCDAGFARLDDEVLNGLPYEVYHPDDFFILIDDCAPEAVQRVTDQQWRYYHARNKDERLPQQLKRAGCPLFAERVRWHLQRVVG